MDWITQLWLFFLALSTVLQLYLSFRQSRVVRQHRNGVPEAFADNFDLSTHQKSADYTLAKQRVARYEIVFQAAILLIFTLGGGLNILAAVAEDFSAHLLHQGVLLIILFLLVNYLISLPFSLYRTFKIEAAFGFNRMSARLFFADQIKGIVLAGVILLPLLYVVLWLMGVMGQLWWLYVWVVWLAFSLLMMWIFPTWIAPLFNQFHKLEDSKLHERIEKLLQRTGFHSKGIFVMDGSKRSGHGNAYFTGLGHNKRIVFFDTLLNKMTHTQIEAILAHELGHFKHKHIIKQMILTFAFSLLILAILGQLIQLPNFYLGLGVVFPSHAMALLLFFLVLPTFTFIFSPLSSILSRRNEYEADRFAAQTASAEDLITALINLYRDNAASLVSDTLYSLFYDSHPNALARITALKRATTHGGGQ